MPSKSQNWPAERVILNTIFFQEFSLKPSLEVVNRKKSSSRQSGRPESNDGKLNSADLAGRF